MPQPIPTQNPEYSRTLQLVISKEADDPVELAKSLSISRIQVYNRVENPGFYGFIKRAEIGRGRGRRTQFEANWDKLGKYFLEKYLHEDEDSDDKNLYRVCAHVVKDYLSYVLEKKPEMTLDEAFNNLLYTLAGLHLSEQKLSIPKDLKKGKMGQYYRGILQLASLHRIIGRISGDFYLTSREAITE